MEFNRRQLTVLVVDDDPSILELLTHFLVEELSHQVIVAPSAEEGLNQLLFYRFDLALLDQSLPGIEGMVLGSYLQEHNPNISVALITGVRDPKLERLCSRQNITFIPKPFDFDEIHEVITRTQDQLDQLDQDAERREIESDHRVHLARHLALFPEGFGLPAPPRRLRDQLIREVKSRLERMRMSALIDEQDRAFAYSGLITLAVLGVRSPRDRVGQNWWEQYDDLMRKHERPTAFTKRLNTEQREG